ncbi:MAG: TetR/AcrR family transcriptional regulator [Paenibacillus sp.]|jgi:AcrR family transcriptional regulator|nr:TetR/AcrR family transcriptional regulator [Paenibacillus sp.]
MYHISNDKRSKESSAWIFDALERLMQTTAYKDIRITDICKEAKIGRVTFYRHYDTIDDILRKGCDEKFAGLARFLFEYKKQHPDTAFFLKPFLQYWYMHPAILILLFKADRANILSECLEKMMGHIQPAIKLVHPANEYSNYFFALRSAIPLAILAEWVKHGLNIAPDELSDMLFNQLKDIMRFNQMT